jgi:hypothetical protein
MIYIPADFIFFERASNTQNRRLVIKGEEQKYLSHDEIQNIIV